MRESLRKPALRRLWLTALFTVVLVAGLAAVFDFYYDLNDDTTIKDIISGAYTGSPSGYSVQMLYPLSFLLSLFYRAIPNVSWYGLFLCVCQFGALSLIAYRLTGLIKKPFWQVLALALEALLALGFLLRQLVMLQYSVTSGICMAAAIFLFLTGEEKDKPQEYVKQNIVPILLVVLSFLIRTEVCVMLLPFLLLAGLGRWTEEEKMFTVNNTKKYLSVLGAALLGMALCLLLDAAAYNVSSQREEWKEFQSFFDARTNLYDFYGLPPYEEDMGMTREAYTLLENYNFSLDESIDAALMNRLVELRKTQAGEGQPLAVTAGFVSRNSVKEAVWLYKKHLLEREDGAYAYLIIALYLSYLLAAMGRRKSGCWWKVLLLAVIRSVLWLYLFMVDRSLERITSSLLLAESMVLLGWLAQETVRKKQESKRLLGSYLLLAVCAAAALGGSLERTRTEYEARERINSRWEALLAYGREHKEAYYLIDVYSSTSYEGVPYSEKVFQDVNNEYRNFDICGGWLSKSPLMREKLAKAGVEDLTQAYFVAGSDKELTWLTEYYASKGTAITIERIDAVYDGDTECFAVYRLSHT